MIFDINKSFFFGMLIWYIMLNGIIVAINGLLGAKRDNTYSTADGVVTAAICLGWILA
jgi:hypothetical protein